jgi:hypothetical protein
MNHRSPIASGERVYRIQVTMIARGLGSRIVRWSMRGRSMMMRSDLGLKGLRFSVVAALGLGLV